MIESPHDYLLLDKRENGDLSLYYTTLNLKDRLCKLASHGVSYIKVENPKLFSLFIQHDSICKFTVNRVVVSKKSVSVKLFGVKVELIL